MTWHLQSLTGHLFSHIAMSSLNSGLLCILNGDHIPTRTLVICSSLILFVLINTFKNQPNEKTNPKQNNLILQELIIYTNMCLSPYSNFSHPMTLYEVGGLVLDTTLKKIRKFTLSWYELPCLYDFSLFSSTPLLPSFWCNFYFYILT